MFFDGKKWSAGLFGFMILAIAPSPVLAQYSPSPARQQPMLQAPGPMPELGTERTNPEQVHLAKTGIHLDYKSFYILNTLDSAPSNDLRHPSEAKFQISFEMPLWGGWSGAYTQVSAWQVWDHAKSSPFRESNYSPELFWAFKRMGRLNWLSGQAGYQHQSNGQGGIASRSWNRWYGQLNLDSRMGRLSIKVWQRVPEPLAKFPGDPLGDDNPDILDFMGDGSLHWQYPAQFHQATGLRTEWMFRQGRKAGRDTLEINVDFPFFLVPEGFLLRMQSFVGYGETLADYNHFVSKVGVGIVVR